jgi:hypothetical protein
LEQRSTIPVDGVGQDAVQTPPVRMVGRRVAPSFDRQVTEATNSPVAHSEVHPIEPQASRPMDLA